MPSTCTISCYIMTVTSDDMIKWACVHAGLGSGFSAGTIYCSHVTANLLIRDMRVNPGCIRALPLDAELLIEGISVTLIDANHCPGAVLLLFKTPPPKGSIYKREVTFGVIPVQGLETGQSLTE